MRNESWTCDRCGAVIAGATLGREPDFHVEIRSHKQMVRVDVCQSCMDHLVADLIKRDTKLYVELDLAKRPIRVVQ